MVTASPQSVPRSVSSRWLTPAILSQGFLAVYLQVVEWIPLGRWNNVAGGNGQASLDIILAIVQAAILLCYWKRWRWAMAAGWGLYAYWFYLEITSWWVPYIRGGSPEFMRFYQRWFANTYKILPAVDGHPVPDAEHTVLVVLVLLVLCSSAMASFGRMRDGSDAPRS